MKILLIIDHYPLPPRLRNVQNSLRHQFPEAEIDVFAWNRNSLPVKENHVYTADMLIGYGNQMQKLKSLPHFYRALRKHLKENSYDVIHAIDFEMFFLAALTKKSAKLVYEVYDIKFFSNPVINSFRSMTEKFLMKHRTKGIILASPFFANYYQALGISMTKAIVINNKPVYQPSLTRDSGFMNAFRDRLQNKTVIAFIGLLRYPEILKNLLTVIKAQEDFVVLFAGDGPSKAEIEDYCTLNHISNVVFTGRYEVHDLKSIYDHTDIVWAAYPNLDLNVKYAVSNKYFESRVFKKPIIVSNQTQLGDEVEKMNLGRTVDPYSVMSIQAVIRSMRNFTGYPDASKSNKNYWQDEEDSLQLLYRELIDQTLIKSR